MAKVILVDLFHPDCSQGSLCVQQRVNRLLEVIGNGAEEPVHLLLHPHTDPDSLSQAALLDRLSALNRRVDVLINQSAVSSLYSFKQAVDTLDATEVQVLTCSRRRAVLKLCEELLFTPVYTFHYRTLFDDLHCPVNDLALTCTQLAQVKDEIASFLQRLPAVKGEITILRSSMISGK